MKKRSFDLLAEHYDRDFVKASIGSAQRNLVYYHLEPLVRVSNVLRILDLGCGTGQDMVFMAQLGHKVIGIDSSSAMISKAAENLEKHRLTRQVELKKQEITHYLSSIDMDVNFDIIFSNFGALNLLPPAQWDKMVGNIHRRSQDGGYLIFIVLNTFCLWETCYFLLRGKLKQAGRRWSRKGTSFVFESGSEERIYYYTPGTLSSLFKPWYRVKRVAPIGCFVPPTYLQPFFVKRKGLLGILYLLDRIALRVPPLAYLADHFMIIMQRND